MQSRTSKFILKAEYLCVGASVESLASQSSIHSHGLSVLDARGFDLGLLSPEDCMTRSISQQPPAQSATRRCTNITISEYRSMLMQRAMADTEEVSVSSPLVYMYPDSYLAFLNRTI